MTTRRILIIDDDGAHTAATNAQAVVACLAALGAEVVAIQSIRPEPARRPTFLDKVPTFFYPREREAQWKREIRGRRKV